MSKMWTQVEDREIGENNILLHELREKERDMPGRYVSFYVYFFMSEDFAMYLFKRV